MEGDDIGDHHDVVTANIWGAQAASPPQDGFAVVNLLVSAASRNEFC